VIFSGADMRGAQDVPNAVACSQESASLTSKNWAAELRFAQEMRARAVLRVMIQKLRCEDTR